MPACTSVPAGIVVSAGDLGLDSHGGSQEANP
jgi:hypothetical protein